MPLPLLHPAQALGLRLLGWPGVTGPDGDEDPDPGEVALAMVAEALFMAPEIAPPSMKADTAMLAPMMASIRAYSAAVAPSRSCQ